MSERRTETAARPLLRVDPTACEGVGICAHLAPETIGLDSWGYPMVAAEPLAGRRLRRATVATAACPRRALHLTANEDAST